MLGRIYLVNFIVNYIDIGKEYLDVVYDEVYEVGLSDSSDRFYSNSGKKEHRLPVIPALGEMLRKVNQYYSCKSGYRTMSPAWFRLFIIGLVLSMVMGNLSVSQYARLRKTR